MPKVYTAPHITQQFLTPKCRLKLTLDMSYGILDVMTATHTVITRLVKNYLHDSGITQKALAADLGITQPTLSRKLSGIRPWSLDDLDQLIQIGVPIGLNIFGAAAMGEYINED